MHTIDDDLFDEKIVNCIRTGYLLFKTNDFFGSGIFSDSGFRSEIRDSAEFDCRVVKKVIK